MLKPDFDFLYIKGNQKFQDVAFYKWINYIQEIDIILLFQLQQQNYQAQQPIRQHHPKVNAIKLKGFQQFVELINKQQEQQQQLKTCSQCTPQLLPTVVSYPPRIEVQTRKASEMKLFVKKSFIDIPTESHSQERSKKDIRLIPQKQFSIKRAITSKNEDSNIIFEQNEFPILIALSNNLSVQPPDRAIYKAFVTKGNNGILIRQSLKQRPWWILVDQPCEDMNFYWTQLRKQAHYEQLQKQQLELASFSKLQKKQVNDKLKYKIEDLEYSIFNQSVSLKIHNHLECNFQVCNKKALFYNMKNYYISRNEDPFQFIPLTYHVQTGSNDPAYLEFEQYAQTQNVNLWIVKPGESSNRGNGIQVANSIQKVKSIISQSTNHHNGMKKTFIVQKYMEKPLLYNKRKFDIRCYILMTSINNKFKAYWYILFNYLNYTKKDILEQVVKSFLWMMQKINLLIQQMMLYKKRIKIMENMKLAIKCLLMNFKNTYKIIIITIFQLQQNNLENQVQIQQKLHINTQIQIDIFILLNYLDQIIQQILYQDYYMIDQDMKPWLIEVNTNPCLETCCPLLARLISHLIENTIRIAIDPMFPPPLNKKKHIQDQKNLFELIFSTTLISDPFTQPIIKEDDEEHDDVEDDN